MYRFFIESVTSRLDQEYSTVTVQCRSNGHIWVPGADPTPQ